MSIAMRSLLFSLVALSATAPGCNNSGGEFIPLAKVEPPKEGTKSTPPPNAPKGVPTSPNQLIYK